MNTVIEITDNFVKIVQARSQAGRVQVVRCAERQLKENSDAELSRVLLELTRGKGVEPDNLILAVARRLAIIKRMKLPSTADAELHKMVGLQLVNQIPFSTNEVAYDYHLIEKDNQGFSHVQAIVINKSVTSRLLRVLNDAGIKSARMTLSCLGVLEWGAHFLKQARDASDAPVLFVDVDYGHTEIIFARGAHLLFSRSINYGQRDLNAQGIKEISRQLQMSMAAYKQEKMGADVWRAVLISGAPQAEALKEAVEQQLGIKVAAAQPFDYVMYKKSILSQNQFSSSMAVPVGLQFASPKRLINLTPAEVSVGKQQTIMRKHWAAFFVLLMAVLGLSLAIFWLDVHFKEEQLGKIRDMGRGFGPQLAHIEKRNRFMQEFNREISKRIYIPQLIDLIYRQAPATVSLRSISLDESKKLILQGYAETGDGINTFQQNLVRSPEFHSVRLEFATKRRIFNIEVTDFKIIADLLVEAKGE